MEYKVVRNFGISEKGDIFKSSEENPFWFTMEKVEDGIHKCMTINNDMINSLEEDGDVIRIESEENTEKTIEGAVEFIDSLLKQYDSDLNETIKKFNNGEIQPCVKLEAETVYFNLMKVLNSVKEKLVA